MNCEKCGRGFPSYVEIDGKKRNLCSRRFCLECSPFGKHNTANLVVTNKDEKWCPKCEKMLPRCEFYIRRGSGCSSYCKSCFNLLCTERQREMKQKAVTYMGGKCRCGYDKCLGALEFHHKDPSEKDPNIRFGSSRKSFKKIAKELDKCIMLCANCHREEHDKIRGVNLKDKVAAF